MKVEQEHINCCRQTACAGSHSFDTPATRGVKEYVESMKYKQLTHIRLFRLSEFE
jgi:hypothetical protein